MFGIVILHYLTKNDTDECIQSILKLNTSFKYNIVIVDNFSNNGSIEFIESKYKEYGNIQIIKNDTNLGFAKGNNIGYRYCRDILKSKFIMVLNNDILLESPVIFEQCINNYEQKQCAIIGPDIISMSDKGHQNPMSGNLLNKVTTIKEIVRYEILCILCKTHIYDYVKKGNKNSNSKKKEMATFINEPRAGVLLHGSFLIYTPIFIGKMNNAFCDETFLYMEEEILFNLCKKNNLLTYYDPVIKVYHKEDSSTNALFPKSNEKRVFVFKNMKKSLFILLKHL